MCARTMDKAFFNGQPILQTELEGAVAKALPEPQSLAVEDHFSPEELRSIATLSDFIVTMLGNQPDSWTEFFRDAHTASMGNNHGGNKAGPGKGGRRKGLLAKVAKAAKA